MNINEFTKLLDVLVWPLVVIVAIFLFKNAIQTFLKNAMLREVEVEFFGFKIKATVAEIARVVWENFDFFRPTNKQRNFLIDLAGRPNGEIAKAEAESMGLDYKEDFRPLRNSGLIAGNATTLNKSNSLTITPLGRFLVKNKDA